jgi:hypothetical protein
VLVVHGDLHTVRIIGGETHAEFAVRFCKRAVAAVASMLDNDQY